MIRESYTYKHYVYKMIFPDGYFYIGCTHQLAKRMYQHDRGVWSNKEFHKRVKKYPFYELEIISVIPHRGKARELESKIIEQNVSNPKLLNRAGKYINTYRSIKWHKDAGHNYDKEKFEKLKKIIGFA